MNQSVVISIIITVVFLVFVLTMNVDVVGSIITYFVIIGVVAVVINEIVKACKK